MTKVYFSILMALGISAVLNAQNVNIPDANFKAYLVGNTAINTNSDTEIQISEANTYTGSILCANLSIADLTGIEAFIMLDTLDCSHNQLTSLDVSANTALVYIHCYNNQLTSLDVSANTALDYLHCADNPLTSLNVSTNTALTRLHCYNAQLTTLNVSANAALTYLWCYGNLLTTLDVSANTVLNDLSCDFNQLTTLDLSVNLALWALSCSHNQFTTLDISANTALTYLNCENNSLTTLDISANTLLGGTFCANNQLTTLDVSVNTALIFLSCGNNQLTTLNVKNGNNSNMPDYAFNATNNPNLSCIEVDDATWSTANWTQKDTIASFSENCVVSVAESSQALSATIYPNPSNGTYTIALDKNYSQINVQVIDVLGQVILAKEISNEQHISLNLNTPKGTYFVNINTNEGAQNTTKVVVE